MAAPIFRSVCATRVIRWSNFARQRLMISKINQPNNYIVVRTYKRWWAPYLQALSKIRRIERIQQGIPGPSPRSSYGEWDYDIELYAFAKRLSEDISDANLRKIFTDQSFIQHQEVRDLESEASKNDTNLPLSDNQELADIGSQLAYKYMFTFLRMSYPYMPVEGIEAVTSKLMGEEILCHIAKHLGTIDLILHPAFPIPDADVRKSFLAIVGALKVEQGDFRAGLFVRDFVLTQLIERDINDMWEIVNPMGLLVQIMESKGMELPESRLLRQSGSGSALPVFIVGLYSNKNLIAEAPGESLIIAEEEGARVALKRFFGTMPNSPPLQFSSRSAPAFHEEVVKQLKDIMVENRFKESTSQS